MYQRCTGNGMLTFPYSLMRLMSLIPLDRRRKPSSFGVFYCQVSRALFVFFAVAIRKMVV